LMGSNLEFHPLAEVKIENHNVKMTGDALDQFSLKEDWTESNPDLNTVERRSVYKSELDFKCLPEGQNIMLLTTFGPTEEYDIISDTTGFRWWGIFKNLKQCALRIEIIRNTNVYGVFFPIHAVQLDGNIDLPPPNDGSVREHQLNKEYKKIVSTHTKKCFQEAKSVFDRKQTVVERSQHMKDETKQYNDKIEEMRNKDHPDTDANKKIEFEKVVNGFERYDRPIGFETTTPGKIPFQECMENLMVIPFELLEAYLKQYEMTTSDSNPDGLICKYKTVTRENGEVVLVKLLIKK